MTVEEVSDWLYRIRSKAEVFMSEAQNAKAKEAVKTAIESLEDKVPKKVRYDQDGFYDGSGTWELAICPKCGYCREDSHDTWEMPFCLTCGQRLYWSKEESE